MKRLALLLTIVLAAAAGLTGCDPVGTDGQFIVKCDFVKTGQFDPIVYPGQSNVGHLHMFFGNRSISPSSTPLSLRQQYKYQGGNGSSCEDGPNGGDAEDTASYWAPVLYVNGSPVIPPTDKIYYNTNIEGTRVNSIPFGLKMIAGNKDAMGRQDTGIVNWGCGNGSGISEVNYIPDCQANGGALASHITFPDCVKGTPDNPVLDSADHKSHLAYSSGGSCPSGFFGIVQVTLRLNWTSSQSPRASDTTRLSSDMSGQCDGCSQHADFVNAWVLNQDTSVHSEYQVNEPTRGLNDLINQCIRTGNHDCTEV
jgi:hypothetical protein